jgi:hypothetical protein
MKLLQLHRRGGTDRGDAGAPQVAQIMKLAKEIIEKASDSVGAGEDEPIVRIEFKQGIHDRLTFGGVLDLDGGNFQDFGT